MERLRAASIKSGPSSSMRASVRRMLGPAMTTAPVTSAEAGLRIGAAQAFIQGA